MVVRGSACEAEEQAHPPTSSKRRLQRSLDAASTHQASGEADPSQPLLNGDVSGPVPGAEVTPPTAARVAAAPIELGPLGGSVTGPLLALTDPDGPAPSAGAPRLASSAIAVRKY